MISECRVLNFFPFWCNIMMKQQFYFFQCTLCYFQFWCCSLVTAETHAAVQALRPICFTLDFLLLKCSVLPFLLLPQEEVAYPVVSEKVEWMAFYLLYRLEINWMRGSSYKISIFLFVYRFWSLAMQNGWWNVVTTWQLQLRKMSFEVDRRPQESRKLFRLESKGWGHLKLGLD